MRSGSDRHKTMKLSGSLRSLFILAAKSFIDNFSYFSAVGKLSKNVITAYILNKGFL